MLQADVTDDTSSENSNVFGKINRTQIDTESLQEFDLEHKDENELWNGGFEADDIIQTTTEGLPSTVVFNLKTDPKWDSHDGSRVRKLHMSRLVGKPTMWFPNRFHINRPVQAQKGTRSLKFRI